MWYRSMKFQFSIIFISIFITISALAIIFLLTFGYGTKQSFSYLTITKNYYYQISDIIYSSGCLNDHTGDPIYYVNLNNLEYLSAAFSNSLPNCGYYPYPFRYYLDGFSFGIINVPIDCSNFSNFVSLNGNLNIAKIEICYNYYSSLYIFLYRACYENKGYISNTTIYSFYPVYIYNNEICSDGICNYLPCNVLDNDTVSGLSIVYVKKVNNSLIVIST